MLSMNDAILNDNQAIFVYQIIDNLTTYYLADVEITLSGNVYNETVISRDVDLTEISENINLEDGGGIGSLGDFAFGITKNADHTEFEDFIDEWYPQTTRYLTNREIRVGVLWDGATTEAEITWLSHYVIEAVEWDDRDIFLQCVEMLGRLDREIPYYSIQTGIDDGISYYPNAKKEAIGKVIPLVYGDFTNPEAEYVFGLFNPVPAILVDDTTLQFVICSHECKTFAISSLYKYSSGVGFFMQLTASNDSGNTQAIDNQEGYCTGSLIDSTGGGQVHSLTYIHPLVNAGETSVSGVPITAGKNLFDLDDFTYITLDPGDKILIRFDVDSGSEPSFNVDVTTSNLLFKLIGNGYANACDYEIKVIDLVSDAFITVAGGGTSITDTATNSHGVQYYAALFNATKNLGTVIKDYAIYIENTDSTDVLRIAEMAIKAINVKVTNIVSSIRVQSENFEDWRATSREWEKQNYMQGA